MNNPRQCLSLASLLVLASGFGLSTAAATAATPQSRIHGSIDDAVRVTLAGNTRPEANSANDLGPVEDGLALDHMQLLLIPAPEQQAAFDAYTASLSDKTSPNFHQWLTAQQIGANYGLSQQDIDLVTGWLTFSGFTVNVVYPNHMLIDFSGTAAQVREAFATEIHRYEVNGVRHIANASAPTIPAALAPVVAGIASLHDFMPRPMHKAKPNYTFTSGGFTYYAVTPPDLATIYNFNPAFAAGYTGKNQTIVVVEDTNVYSTSDWTNFRSTFGLSKYTAGSFRQLHPGPYGMRSNCTNPGVNSDDVEAIIDAEYASAAAPSAGILLASCSDTNTTFGGLIALENLLTNPVPPALVSISYGECEADNGAVANFAYRIAYEQAAVEGVSVFVSAGDEGAASCDANQTTATHGIGVSGFASTPFNVAVGGTDFGDSYLGENTNYWNATNTSTYGSAISYMPEIPWNDSCAGTLLSNYVTGSPITYGTNGFCNTATGEQFLTTASGSGGPSGCATGFPIISGVVGGTCRGYPKPYWQSLAGVPGDNVRDIPDVSLFAANGLWGHYYPICFSDPNNGGGPCTGAPSGWPGYGGTSFASPIMAGIQALVNQKWGRQGNPNPTYYSIADAEYGSNGSAACNSSNGSAVGPGCVFYDVTLGDMDVNCAPLVSTGPRVASIPFNCYLDGATNGVLSTSNLSYEPAFMTGTGWDFATGIGTVNVYNLLHSASW